MLNVDTSPNGTAATTYSWFCAALYCLPKPKHDIAKTP